MKAVVLGSNSFSGSHMVSRILDDSNYSVIGISRSPEYDPLFLPYLYHRDRPRNFKFHQLDMNKDLSDIIRLLDKERPETIINFAAQGEVRNSWKCPEQWFQTNSMALVKFTNVLKDRDYLKKYIHISTPEVYGATGTNIKENYNYYPSTPYAASKLAGELFLYSLFKKYKFPVSITRAANVYGIHQQLYRIIPRTIINLKLGKKLMLHGRGRAVRSFINIEDVIEATWKIVKYKENGEIYHIAPESDGRPIRDLVGVICDMMGRSFEDSVEFTDENFGQDARYSLNSDKVRRLGWKPTISLKDGIGEVIQWIEGNWKQIKKLPLEYIHKR